MGTLVQSERESKNHDCECLETIGVDQVDPEDQSERVELRSGASGHHGYSLTSATGSSLPPQEGRWSVLFVFLFLLFPLRFGFDASFPSFTLLTFFVSKSSTSSHPNLPSPRILSRSQETCHVPANAGLNRNETAIIPHPRRVYKSGPHSFSSDLRQSL
jgi:hypothetical protein